MFVPTSCEESLGLLGLTVVCWGSWGTTAKLSRLPFPCFYFIFTLSAFGWSAVLGLVLGANLYGPDDAHRGFIDNRHDEAAVAVHHGFLSNLREVGVGPAVWFACLSGLLSNCATILLTLLISTLPTSW